MPGQRPILAMSFVASLGLFFEILSCNLPRNQGNFWPLLIFIFYILLPLPFIFAKRIIKDTLVGMDERDASRTRHFAVFFTAGIMVSSFALPILLARSPMEKPLIAPIQCILLELGNLLCYVTMGLFCIYFKPMTK